jgi:Tfp pilus assembly protein PilF
LKKGPIIIVSIGVVITLLLWFSPVTPGGTETASDADKASTGQSVADSLVEDALQKMESGALPPMQAVLTIRDIAERFPDNVKANFTLGVMSLQTNQLDKAIQRFQKVIESDNEHMEARRLLANTYLNAGDTATALSSIEKAIEIAPSEETIKAFEQLKASINNP